MRSGGPPLPPCGGGPFRSYPFMLQTCYARSGAKSRWTGFGKPSCKREASLLRKRGLSLQRERTQRFRRSSAGKEARGRVVLCREGASTNVVARRLAPLSVAGACRHRVRPENDACNEGPRAHAGKQRCESAKQLRLKQLKHCRCCAAVSHSEPMSAGSVSVYELLQRMRRLARMAGEPVLRGTPGPGKAHARGAHSVFRLGVSVREGSLSSGLGSGDRDCAGACDCWRAPVHSCLGRALPRVRKASARWTWARTWANMWLQLRVSAGIRAVGASCACRPGTEPSHPPSCAPHIAHRPLLGQRQSHRQSLAGDAVQRGRRRRWRRRGGRTPRPRGPPFAGGGRSRLQLGAHPGAH